MVSRIDSNAGDLAPPGDIDSYHFTAGFDELVVLSFPVAVERTRHELLEDLTPTERAIAALVVEGRSTSEIARARGTSPHTITNQLGTIYRKIGITSRRELVACVRKPAP
jgi:DNA-binding CsgD family transcriptional regulator